MRNTREILRQKWTLGRSHREVGLSVAVLIGAVSAVIARAIAAGLDWPAAQALTDDALEAKLYPSVAAASERTMPDCAYLHVERRKMGVTLELLHLEYLEKHPNGYRYTQFCERYREWLDKRRLTMRQEHRAGEKFFVDYSGKKPHIVDPKTGEVIEVELFVAALGASIDERGDLIGGPEGLVEAAPLQETQTELPRYIYLGSSIGSGPAKN